MIDVASGTTLIDVEHLGRRRVIASCLLAGAGAGGILIDPGPSSTRVTLEGKLAARGLSLGQLDAILLTHIHLDHAGATGSIVQDHPHLRVYVHERGAPHLADPTKLLGSAERLYGKDMERLWGAVDPVPETSLRTLAGGETIVEAGRRLEVAYTPGHASHHVTYYDGETAIAFVGDTAGVRILEAPYVAPPTPPPDIALDQWRESLETIRRFRPSGLFLTHFGLASGVESHLAELWKRLGSWSEYARQLLDEEGDDEARAARFGAWALRDLRERLPRDLAECYVQGGPPTQSFGGLARYWRKREEANA